MAFMEIYLKNTRPSKKERQNYPYTERPPQKATILSKYRPITCLPMMWKIQTAWIKQVFYNAFVRRGLLLQKQNVREGREERGSYSTLISTSSRRKKSQKNVILWIGYKKNYDEVPQTDYWMSENKKNIRKPHELNHRRHEKLESRINSLSKNFSKGENPLRHLPAGFALTITICSSNVDTQLNT